MQGGSSHQHRGKEGDGQQEGDIGASPEAVSSLARYRIRMKRIWLPWVEGFLQWRGVASQES